MNDLVKYFYLSFVTFNLPWTSVTIITARNAQQMFAFKFYKSKFVCVCGGGGGWELSIVQGSHRSGKVLKSFSNHGRGVQPKSGKT